MRLTEEDRLQTALCRLLEAHARPDVLWHAIPNGGKRDRVEGAKLMLTGTVAGAADLFFLIDGSAHYLELKTAKGRMSADQERFMERVQRAWGHYHVARSLDEARDILQSIHAFRPPQGVGVRNIGASAPMTSSPREPGVSANAG